MSKIIFAILLSTAFLNASKAVASHQTEIREASSSYRDAALLFGRAVINDRNLDVYQKRVGHDLLRLSARMQVYCRTPSLVNRLQDCWWDLEDLHRRIELTLFNRSFCHLTVSLRPCYESLLCAYYDLETSLAHIGCYHRHGEIHLYRSPAITKAFPSRFNQPTLVESVLGAVISGIEASRARDCQEDPYRRNTQNDHGSRVDSLRFGWSSSRQRIAPSLGIHRDISESHQEHLDDSMRRGQDTRSKSTRGSSRRKR